jgi:ABC-type tungstate transport system permease subunit
VRVVAVGTGEAIEIAKRGDADVLFVHYNAAFEKIAEAEAVFASRVDDSSTQVKGDPNLINQYGMILVNSKKYSDVKAVAGQEFIDWLISKEGQRAIVFYKLEGQRLFHPNANNPEA